jgi:RND family efflux transporter MFP subunit
MNQAKWIAVVSWMFFGAGLPTAFADDPNDSGQAKVIELKDCLIKAVKTAQLSTDRPGVLASVGPNEGDTVQKGDVVVKLIDEIALANLEVAKLVAESTVEVEFARLSNEVDKVEHEKALYANRQHANAVTDIEVRRFKLAVDKSRLQIDKARHDVLVNEAKVKQAEAELNTFRILAPFDGRVTQVKKRYRGEAVRQGDTILQIVNTDVVRVEGDVSEAEVWNVKPGAPVAVQLSVEDAELEVEKKVFYGRIGFVDVVANEGDRKTRVWAEVPNPDNILRPGLKATMTINPRSQNPRIKGAGVKTSMTSPTASGRLGTAAKSPPYGPG